jgi:hypothetical protein
MDTRKMAAEYRLSHWAQVMSDRVERGTSIREFCDAESINENTYFYLISPCCNDAAMKNS